MKSLVINYTNIEKELETISWTPLHTRLLAHRIGDGSVNHYGHLEYNNKHIQEFIDLAKFLKIKYWGPVVSDKYGTFKVIIPKKTFRDFASIFEITHEELIRNPLLLLDIMSKLPQEHQIQAILAFIVDDGSCKNWRLVVFEDQNEQVFNKVKELWDDLFLQNSKIYVYTTKNKTKVYHLMVNRDGIISLALKIKESTENYGNLANLWWKQKDFDYRYKIAVSKRAIDLYETLNNNENRNYIIFNYLKENKYITSTKAQKILNLSRDRTMLVLSKLTKENRLFLIDAGNKSKYSIIDEDISLEARKNVVVEFLMSNKRIYNRDCRKLLNLGEGRAYEILKILEKQGVIKQIKEKGTTCYILS